MTTYRPRPGAIGLVPVRGWGGAAIRLGEFVLDGLCVVQHAFVLLDDGTVIGAEPEGATIFPLSHYADVPVWWIDREVSDATRALVVAEARSWEHRPYSWWAYLWVGALRLGLRPRWLQRKVAAGRAAMCSQMADLVWRAVAADPSISEAEREDLTLFAGRPAGAVSPGDLYQLADAVTPAAVKR